MNIEEKPAKHDRKYINQWKMSQDFRKPSNFTHESHEVDNIIILQNISELQWTVREQLNVKALNLRRFGHFSNLEQKMTHLVFLAPFDLFSFS